MVEQAPEKDFVYVGFWLRFVAVLIDSVLVLIITYPILGYIYGGSAAYQPVVVVSPHDAVSRMLLRSLSQVLQQGGSLHSPGKFLVSWVFPGIACILFWIARSATPGKMLFRAKIVDARTGGKPTSTQCVIRYFAYLASILPFFLGFLWIAFDNRKQGFHDKLAGTVVVRPRRRNVGQVHP
jgi:uncharacterized RDD family membrane protein YckC